MFETELQQKVASTIEKYDMIHKGDSIVVAVSGGPDSVALLLCLNELKNAYSISISVAHLNHGIRGAEADEDARFVENLAAKLGLPCFLEKQDVLGVAKKQGISVEEAGRNARYEFFERVRRKIGAQKIAVGHTKNDLAETVLMKLLRGAGSDGVSGIKPVTATGVIRPLIEVTRGEITDYLRKWQDITPRVDLTNFDPGYLRNKIRLELIPVLEKEYNPNLIESLAATAQILWDEVDLLDEMSENAFKDVSIDEKGVVLDVKGLVGYPPAIQRRVIRKAFARTGGDIRHLTYNQVEEVRRLARGNVQGGPEKKLCLPGNIWARVAYGKLSFARTRDACAARYGDQGVLQIPGVTVAEQFNLKFEAAILPREEIDPEYKNADRFTAFLDFDSLSLPLCFRRWKPGDRFVPLGMNDFKKVKDFFIDLKVDRQVRNRTPVVTSDSQIAWLVGFRIDHRVRVQCSTRTVLKLKVFPAYAD